MLFALPFLPQKNDLLFRENTSKSFSPKVAQPSWERTSASQNT